MPSSLSHLGNSAIDQQCARHDHFNVKSPGGPDFSIWHNPKDVTLQDSVSSSDKPAALDISKSIATIPGPIDRQEAFAKRWISPSRPAGPLCLESPLEPPSPVQKCPIAQSQPQLQPQPSLLVVQTPNSLRMNAQCSLCFRGKLGHP